MKILHTVDTCGMYGKERMLLTLISHQVADGHIVSVAGFGEEDFFKEALNIANGEVTHFDATLHLTRLLSLINYDIIHTHDIKTGVLVSSWHIFHPKTRVVRTIHGYTATNDPWYSKKNLYQIIDRVFLHFNSVNVGVSPDLATKLNAKLIYNGIEPVELDDDISMLDPDIVEFCNTPVDGKKDKKELLIFCCMARLSPEKNLEFLITAIMNSTGTKLLLIGDGPLKDKLKDKIKYRPEKVCITGFIKNAKDYLRLTDIYIQPSLTEGMPISVLEAMSAGIPIMTSNVGGMKLLHEAGIVTDTTTEYPNFLAARMVTMKTLVSKRNDMSYRGKKFFNETFSAEKMHEAYLNVYLNN